MNKQISFGRMYEGLAGVSLIFYIGVAPLYKYGEYVYGFPRVNVTLVMSTFLVMLMFLGGAASACSKKMLLSGCLTLAAAFLVLWVSILQVVQVPFLISEVDAHSVLTYLSRTLVTSVVLFLVGMHLEGIAKNWKGPILIFWACAVAIYSYGTYQSSGFYIYLDGEQIYLMLSDAFLLLAFLTIYCVRSNYLKVVVFVISVVILLTLLSRSALLLFVLSVFSYVFVRKPLSALACLFASGGLVALGWMQLVAFFGERNRFVRFFVSGEDSSFSSRMELTRLGFEDLQNNWLLGRYMYDVVRYDITGAYAHNYMSFWTAYGVGPSFLFVVIGVVFIVNALMVKNKSSYYGLIIMLLVANILAILISKSYLYPYIWLAVGAAAVYFDSTRQMVLDKGSAI